MISIPFSSQELHCEGYSNPGASGNGYLLGFVLGVGKTKTSTVSALDDIVAFDAAEIEDTMFGQINMITVSSFCGPLGLIWGYDLVPHDNLRAKHQFGPSEVTYKRETIPVYSLVPLLEATNALFGKTENKRFNLLSGSHVPCASKHEISKNPGYLYCSISIGIPKDRNKDACLMMEDTGLIKDESEASRKAMLQASVESIMRVGVNQKVSYAEIFTDIKTIKIENDETGCALVAAPYFTLARNATLGLSEKMLCSIKLSEWEEKYKNEK